MSVAIQLGCFIEAVDVPTGRKVVLDRWFAYVSGGDEAARFGRTDRAGRR